MAIISPGTVHRAPDTALASPSAARRAARAATATPPPICGLSFDATHLMGIVNVTPDSFSDGGDHAEADAAVAHGRAQAAAGATVIDVGGESTKPGSRAPELEEELRRVVPVVRRLAAEGLLVSIDTRRAAVMAAALDAGARIVNDVSALRHDPRSLPLIAERAAAVVLTHMQGTPETMQRAPRYDDVVREVHAFLARRVADCEAAGISRARIIVDPGIGFGKTIEHNLALLRGLALYKDLGCALMLGASRKGFIGALSGGAARKDRAAGSIAVALHGLDRGVHILRVHDVAETRQAVALWRAIRNGHKFC